MRPLPSRRTAVRNCREQRRHLGWRERARLWLLIAEREWGKMPFLLTIPLLRHHPYRRPVTPRSCHFSRLWLWAEPPSSSVLCNRFSASDEPERECSQARRS